MGVRSGAALFWARAFGITETAELASAKAGVSKVTKRLADLKLIGRERVGRKSKLVLLREDGSDDPYTRPQTNTDPYFKLSYDYWTKAYFDTLSLPAKALLLIVLSRPNELYLPLEQAKPWYGISADTAQRGLAELRDKDLVAARTEWVQEARSETGWIEKRFYTPAGNFAAGGATVTSLSTARRNKREASA